MSTIAPHYRSVQRLLQSQSFSIDEYQREYKWKKENIDELLSDLQAKFFSHYKLGDETPAVSGYSEYFLGPRHRLAHARYRLVGSRQLDRHRKSNEVVFPEFGFVVDALDLVEHPCIEWVLWPARYFHVPIRQTLEKALGIMAGTFRLSFLHWALCNEVVANA
ncbi:hypothetical protein OKW30_007395 [Paraburkholderia sp. Clong3]